MPRGRRGYGLSLSGARPAVVCRVLPCSEAALSGVELGDQVLKVAGHSVLHLRSQDVANVMRYVLRHTVCARASYGVSFYVIW